METISWQDFERIELVTGTILAVEEFPEAKKSAYKLKIDLGKNGIKNSSAQITKLYTKEELLGMQVLCVINFPPKKIASFVSEVLVCGFLTDEGVVLATTEQKIANGLKLC